MVLPRLLGYVCPGFNIIIEAVWHILRGQGFLVILMHEFPIFHSSFVTRLRELMTGSWLLRSLKKSSLVFRNESILFF